MAPSLVSVVHLLFIGSCLPWDPNQGVAEGLASCSVLAGQDGKPPDPCGYGVIIGSAESEHQCDCDESWRGRPATRSRRSRRSPKILPVWKRSLADAGVLST